MADGFSRLRVQCIIRHIDAGARLATVEYVLRSEYDSIVLRDEGVRAASFGYQGTL